jgi:glutamate---cysteine ligase / carboxylate-amine ligase
MPAEPDIAGRSPASGAARLFTQYGVELEYMIVDARTLDVRPVADQLLTAAAGELTDEFESGTIAWNNELALHVIEFKCNGPQPQLSGLAGEFQRNVDHANRLLAEHGLRLMPTAMHPWMDPATELKLWPHGTRIIYDTFDRIFSCRGHGWANLQSAHLNLPFADDDEFARLHAAIRFLIPLMPGLCAGSPVMDGRRSGTLDNRLAVYRGNCARIPSVTGAVVPEPVTGMDEYHDRILAPVYRDLEPHDPDGVLRHEWVNARGAIARFDRMAIEIRVLDVQECPAADLARSAIISAVLQSLCEAQWCDPRALNRFATAELTTLYQSAVRDAEHAEIGRRDYLAALGVSAGGITLHRLWEKMIEHAAANGALDHGAGRMAELYLREGSLATRILTALGEADDRTALDRVYGALCDALADGNGFSATD